MLHLKPDRTIRTIVRSHIEQTLAACNGSISEAAQVLGVYRTTLQRRMRADGLSGWQRMRHRLGEDRCTVNVSQKLFERIRAAAGANHVTTSVFGDWAINAALNRAEGRS